MYFLRFNIVVLGHDTAPLRNSIPLRELSGDITDLSN